MKFKTISANELRAEAECLADKMEELDTERRLLIIRRDALENMMRGLDPFGDDFDLASQKWKALETRFSELCLEIDKARSRSLLIENELCVRRSRLYPDKRQWGLTYEESE